MARRVAITGATGFLGTALVQALADAGDEVTVLARATSDPAGVAHVRARAARLVVADVTDAAALRGAFEGADAVVHAAGVIGYRRRLYAAMRRVNVEGTRAVLDAVAAAGAGRLVHVSSIVAVGFTEEPVPLDEDAAWNAAVLRAPYFDTKHAGEQLVLAAAARGLDATVVNPAAIYGPSPVRSNSSGLLVQIAKGQVPAAPAGGINCVPLGTVVEGVLAALDRGARGRRYVLGGENLEIAGLFERIARALGRTPRAPRRFPTSLRAPLRAAMELAEPLVPARAHFTPDLCAMFGRFMWFDTGRAERELGVRASPFDACLDAAVAALRARGDL